MIDDYPILTLLPPVLAIGLAVTTRKVLLSLGLGVVSAALLVADLSPVDTLDELWSAFAQIFWGDGELNTTYVYILVFTLALGVITAFVSIELMKAIRTSVPEEMASLRRWHTAMLERPSAKA